MGMRWVTFQSHHKDSLGEVSGGALRTVGGAVKVMPFTLGLPWAHSPGAASLVRLELCVWPGGSSHLESVACRHIWILEIPLPPCISGQLTAGIPWLGYGELPG